MKFYITDYLPFEERKKYEKLGLYCYDLRSSDDGSEIANIEKRVIVNNVGSIITNKKISFNRENYVDFDTFASIITNKKISFNRENYVDFDTFASINNEVFHLKDLFKNRKMERDTR